jgi:SAM-dependent methyltransferase
MQVKNSLRGLLQRHAPARIKRWLWNLEFTIGKWDCLDNMPDDCVFPHLEKYANGGDILDLGCGPGAIGSGLKLNSYRSYTGVDISDAAIAKAKRKDPKNLYLQGDILSFTLRSVYDVILFGDSIYYFPQSKAEKILNRYSKYLAPNGVLLIRTWAMGERAKKILAYIERSFDVVERTSYLESKLMVIACRTKREGERGTGIQRYAGI